MARDLGELNREDFARYKDDVKKEGKPFFPLAIFHDTVMSFVVVCVIVALAAIWYFDADGVKSGHPRAVVHGAGRSGDDELRPATRLVLLLPLLPPPDLQVAGDGVHRHRRHPDHRPDPAPRAALLRPAPRAEADASPRRDGGRRAHGHLDGHAHVEGSDRERGPRLGARRSRPLVGPAAGLRGRQGGDEGRHALRTVGLPELPHVPRVRAPGNLGAPDLSAIGATNDRAVFVQYLTNPAAFGNNVMGSYAYLGQDNLKPSARSSRRRRAAKYARRA